MVELKMIFMNVDFPEKKCTVHKKACAFILSTETANKGIGRNLIDGGWYHYPTLADAEDVYKEKYADLKFKKCGKCF